MKRLTKCLQSTVGCTQLAAFCREPVQPQPAADVSSVPLPWFVVRQSAFHSQPKIYLVLLRTMRCTCGFVGCLCRLGAEDGGPHQEDEGAQRPSSLKADYVRPSRMKIGEHKKKKLYARRLRFVTTVTDGLRPAGGECRSVAAPLLPVTCAMGCGASTSGSISPVPITIPAGTVSRRCASLLHAVLPCVPT